MFPDYSRSDHPDFNYGAGRDAGHGVQQLAYRRFEFRPLKLIADVDAKVTRPEMP
jgi:hypothetical protein